MLELHIFVSCTDEEKAVGLMEGDGDIENTWFVAQLRPNGLKNAQINLARQNFQTLMPSLQVTKRIGSRMVLRSEPLFSGYIFVKIQPDSAPWHKINNTLGISKLIMGIDGGPAIVPADFIECLLTRVDEEGQLPPVASLPTGTKVQITSGPFADWFAEVEACTKGERVGLLLSFMGRVVRTDLSLHEVKTA